MKALILLLVLINSSFTSAHSGRTNSEGCHNDKKNNDYHCHSKASKPLHTTSKIDVPAPNYAIAPSTFYNRKDWPHWIDADNDPSLSD